MSGTENSPNVSDVILLLKYIVGLIDHFPAGISLPKNPVIFIHGFMGSAGQFNKMRQHLIANQWPPEYLFSIQYSDTSGSNVDNANELGDFVDLVLQLTGKDKVDIVAHSMGGLSSRYYIKNNIKGGGGKVANYVSLGSPHHGTVTTYFKELVRLLPWYISLPVGYLMPDGVNEMEPGSSFLNALNSGDETPNGTDPYMKVLYTCVWSDADVTVPPVNKTSELKGARNLKVEGVSHNDLTLDERQVFPIILQALGHYGPDYLGWNLD